MSNNTTALTFQTLGLSTVELTCIRLIPVEETKGGKTRASAEAKMVQREGLPNSLFAQITMNVIGQPNDRPDEISFKVKLTLETQLLFASEAPDPKKLSTDLARSIYEPLFFTALERCRMNVWQLGYGGVRLPIKRLDFNKVPDLPTSTTKVVKKRTPNLKVKSKS
ncbi:MAG: hypothetical protein ABIO88_04925 [Burkholderiaceae bacterium]